MSKKKFVVAKFIIFVIFVMITVYFIRSIKYQFYKFRTDKAKETNQVINSFDIRTRKFYENKPELFYQPKINIEKKIENMPESVNLGEENTEIATDNQNKKDGKERVKAENANYYIQIAVYSDEKNARLGMERLKKYNPEIVTVKSEDKLYYKLIILGFLTFDEAVEYRDKLKVKENLKDIPLVRRSREK